VCIGPDEFKEKYGGDLDRLKANALRIYKFANDYVDEVYWRGTRRYDLLHEGDGVCNPVLLWVHPTLQEELKHPDEQLLLRLDAFHHFASRLADQLASRSDAVPPNFQIVQQIREETREWEHRAAARFPVRRDQLHASGIFIDKLLYAMTSSSPPTRDALLDQLRGLQRALNYLLYEAIDLRNAYRNAPEGTTIFKPLSAQ
jgi:hypothetical protein